MSVAFGLPGATEYKPVLSLNRNDPWLQRRVQFAELLRYRLGLLALGFYQTVHCAKTPNSILFGSRRKWHVPSGAGTGFLPSLFGMCWRFAMTSLALEL